MDLAIIDLMEVVEIGEGVTTTDLGKPDAVYDENGTLTEIPNWAYRTLIGLGG